MALPDAAGAATAASRDAGALQRAIEAWHEGLTPELAGESWQWLTDQLSRRRLFFGDRPLCTVLRPRRLERRRRAPEGDRGLARGSHPGARRGVVAVAHRSALAAPPLLRGPAPLHRAPSSLPHAGAVRSAPRPDRRPAGGVRHRAPRGARPSRSARPVPPRPRRARAGAGGAPHPREPGLPARCVL